MDRQRMDIGRAAMVALVFGVGMGMIGCAQNTETPVGQWTDQTAATPVATDQQAATQGSQVYVWVVNAPGRATMPNPGEVSIGTGESLSKLLASAKNEAGGNEVTGVDAGFAQSGITINVTTGGTAPSLTGTATGTGSATQSPGQSVASYPIQDIKPEITATVPIGLAMPGGMVDQQAVATGRGQTSDTGKTSENELRWQRIEAAASQLEQLAPLLDAFWRQQNGLPPAELTPETPSTPGGE